MSDWVRRLFIERSDLFLKLLNQRWPRTPELVDGIIKVLGDNEISSGDLLDLCCGNGRVSVHMAKRGFRALGVDISEAFLKDARRKAEENGVSGLTTFLKGDVRNLRDVIREAPRPFDVVVSAWTSIGYYSEADELGVFRQARELSREGAILLIAETVHTEYLSLKFYPTSYAEIDNLVMLESRKYDPMKALASTSWTFYDKRGENLDFIDRVDFEHHIYNLSELSSLLGKAGWETMASYASFLTLQPMSPLTSMNIVARAK